MPFQWSHSQHRTRGGDDTLAEMHSGTTPPVSGGLGPLLTLRALTVVNDNVLRWLAIGLGKRAVGSGQVALVLTLGTAGFVLPFVVLAWLAGYLADRYPKRSVILWCKFAEIGIVLAAAGAIAWGVQSGGLFGGLPGGLWLLLGSVVLIGCQAALLAPSMIGSLPETVPASRLSAANGLFAMITLVATLVGTAGGNWLADQTPLPGLAVGAIASPSWSAAAPAAAGLVAVAVAGWLAAFGLMPRPAADPTAPPPWNALKRTWADLAELFRSRELTAAAAGSAFFWALGAVGNLNIDQFGSEGGASSQTQIVPLLVALGAGIGLGSLLAGRLSSRGVNLGLVPVGALVVAGASFCLAGCPQPIFAPGGTVGFAWWWAVGCLLLLGLGAGVFDVPLEAYFQERSPPARRGALLAAQNLLVFTTMFAASMLYGVLRVSSSVTHLPLVSARGMFGLFGGLALVAAGLAVYCAPRSTLRAVVAALVHAVYRFRIRRDDLLPATGPALVVANHLSWLDGFIVVLAAPRLIRLVVFGPNIQSPFLRRLADQWRFILFDPRPKSIGVALKTMQAGLRAGDVIGIFSEGGISRTGQILGFKRGLEWILQRVEAPIVPLHIDGMWGSLLSFSEGKFFSKRIKGFRRPVTLTFGTPLPVGTPPHQARQALQELSAEVVRRRMLATRSPQREVAAWLRLQRGNVVAIDAAGQTLTGADLLAAGGSAHSAGSAAPLERLLGWAAGHGAPGGPDWAALAAAAEAFDGACLVRRTDRMLSSLGNADPLGDSLGACAGPLLGIECIVADPALPAASLRDTVQQRGITLWLASIEQVLAVVDEPENAASPLPGWCSTLDVVVIPVGSWAEGVRAQEAAGRFHRALGIEPVVAFAPRAAGGLVAMNSPPSRAAVEHEVTLKADTLGRVLNGVVVWPRRDERHGLGLPPCGAGADADTLVIGATLAGPSATPDGPAVWVGVEPLEVDQEGFLVPRGMLPAPPDEKPARR